MSADPIEARLRDLPRRESAVSAIQVLTIARERRRRRTRWAAAGAGLALAATGLLALTVASNDPTRARGLATAAPVALEAAIEGPDGPRAWRAGLPVAAHEALVLRVLAGGPGILTVWEGGHALWPTDGRAWAVDEGTHYLGGHEPLAWRPDAGAGTYVVTATLCPEATSAPASCSHAELAVAFE